MEDVCSSETSVAAEKTIQRHNPKELSRRLYRREGIKSPTRGSLVKIKHKLLIGRILTDEAGRVSLKKERTHQESDRLISSQGYYCFSVAFAVGTRLFQNVALLIPHYMRCNLLCARIMLL